MNAVITGQQVAHSALPEFGQAHIKEEVELRYGVAQLEHMVKSEKGGNIKLQHPGMPDVARVMNSDAPYGNSISSVYWSVRSEEHTSELQSLMRISYAVFCLKTKTQQPQHSIQSPPTSTTYKP